MLKEIKEQTYLEFQEYSEFQNVFTFDLNVHTWNILDYLEYSEHFLGGKIGCNLRL